MACAERWLFRMWQLYLFLIPILIVTQNVSAEVQNSSKGLINNETISSNTVLDKSSKTAESPSAFIPTVVKSKGLPSGSNPLTDFAKPIPEGTTKPPKETVTNQTPTKTAENVQNIPPTSNSSISEIAKTSSPINSKQFMPVIKDPILLLNSASTVNEKSSIPTKSDETKPEQGKVPLVMNISSKSVSSEAVQEAISTTTLPKVSQAPLLSQPKDVDGQPSEAFEEIEDFRNTPLTNPEMDYEGNDDTDEMDSPPKIDDTVIAEEKSAAKKDESKPQTYHPKHAIGSDEFDNGDSHFFIYFLTVVGMCIVMYVLFHNKQKILALIVEGRQERRRRPNTSQYRPLDNNLEEVIQAGAPKNGRLTTNIIY